MKKRADTLCTLSKKNLESEQNEVLKTGSDKKIHRLGRYSFVLDFIMSTNVRGCVLNFSLEYEIINLLGFFYIIKPRRKEYLLSQ